MDVQALIGEVAKRHNVLVDPKDPIFVTVTLNEILLDEHVRRLQASLEEAQRTAAAASYQQVDLAKRIASQFVTDGAKFTTEQVRAAGSVLRAQLERLVQDCNTATLAATAEAERYRRQSQWSAAVAIAGACIAVATTAALWLRGP
jgi:hypothetical protein